MKQKKNNAEVVENTISISSGQLNAVRLFCFLSVLGKSRSSKNKYLLIQLLFSEFSENVDAINFLVELETTAANLFIALNVPVPMRPLQ